MNIMLPFRIIGLFVLFALATLPLAASPGPHSDLGQNEQKALPAAAPTPTATEPKPAAQPAQDSSPLKHMFQSMLDKIYPSEPQAPAPCAGGTKPCPPSGA